MKKIWLEKTNGILDCLKALENRTINLDASRINLELPGRIGRILVRNFRGMNLDERDAVYANIASEYVNSIIEADFEDTPKTYFWKMAEEQCHSIVNAHTRQRWPIYPAGVY